MPTSSLLDRAESWAASLWEITCDRWPERKGQDRNYRAHVVHPAVRSALREFCPEPKIRLLDLGCGDGAFLEDLENRAMLLNGAYLGVDISAGMVEKAAVKHCAPGCRFAVGNLADRNTMEYIRATGEVWNCALTIFVIQEMPDLRAFLGNLEQILPPGALALMVTVHPSFAEWLRDTGGMPLAEELGEGETGDSPLWRWAGMYPIVDEPREPFYLPYFHRTEEDYRSLFQSAGFMVREMRGIPSAKELAVLREREISPFLPFATNIYWPRIGEGASGMIIVAEKEGNHA